jgi:hypothetical protein
MAKVKTKTKTQCRQEAKEKKAQVKEEVKTVMQLNDSPEKFEKLISITTKYEKFLAKLINSTPGIDFGPSIAILTPEHWKAKAYQYKKKAKAKEAKSKPVVDDGYYNIMLCWSVQPDYCLCESIIEKLRKYFESVKVPAIDLAKTEFPDRTEFCETYKLRGSKEKYDLILNSADYLLHILADSTYDKCNIGIFGRSF